jgi:hypothetical protein
VYIGGQPLFSIQISLYSLKFNQPYKSAWPWHKRQHVRQHAFAIAASAKLGSEQ